MLKLNLLAASACVFVTESLAETRVIGEAAISSGLHDRGEQIGPLTLNPMAALSITDEGYSKPTASKSAQEETVA